MARSKPPAPPAPLPPPTAWACWATFLKWVLGVPLAVAGAGGVIWAALWATGAGGMSWQAESDMATTLFWLAAIVLMYPVLLFIWVGDLRAGLREARRWAALSDAERAAELAAQPPPPAPARRRARRKG